MNCKKIFWTLFLCLMLVIQANTVIAQAPQTIEIGPHFGATEYNGDLNPWKQFNQPDLEYGAVVRFNYNTRWTFRADYTHAVVKASDEIAKWRPERQLSFRSIVNDFSLMAEFNFFDYYTGNAAKSLSPYIFGGISVFKFAPYSYDGTVALSEIAILHNQDTLYGTEMNAAPYSTWGFSVPFGIGLKWSISKHLATTFEWRMHFTSTDYLDDVHGTYPQRHAIVNGVDYTDPSGNYSAEMQRGESQGTDLFGFFGASLTWKFEVPKRSHCNMKF